MTSRRNSDGSDAPDAPVTAEERARASALAERVDELLRREPRPPAMAADERTLLEIATAIRAGAGVDGAAISPARTAQLVDAALSPSSTTIRAEAPVAPGAAPTDQARPVGGLQVLRRAAPWTIAVASAAAALLLALRAPAPQQPSASDGADLPRLSEAERSRPADALVGQITAAEAHMASARIDTIYTDRMRGFRSLSLGRAGRP